MPHHHIMLDLKLKRTFLKVPHPDCSPSAFTPACNAEGCSAKVWFFDVCMGCTLYLCPSHSKHPCLEKETFEHQRAHFKAFMRDPISDGQVEASLNMLRPHQSAELKLWSGDQSNPINRLLGGYHRHGIVEWDDGQRWLARFATTACGTPELRKTIMDIELATTIQAAKICPSLVPQVWPAPLPVEHVDYFFMEFKDGVDVGRVCESFSDEEERALADGIAEYFIRISQHTFDGVGSFHPGPHGDLANLVIGPLFNGFGNLTAGCYPYGPFITNGEAYLTLLSDMLRAIESRVLYDSPDDTIPANLVFLDARTLVATCADMNKIEPTYLCHGDLTLNNVLWDVDTKQISAVIDWELSYTAPMAEAFTMPPILAYWMSKDKPSPMYALLQQALKDRGRPDIADCINRGGKFALLRRLLTIGMPWKFGSCEDIWRLRHSFIGDQAGPEYTCIEDFVADAVTRHGTNPGFLAIKARVEELKSQHARMEAADVS